MSLQADELTVSLSNNLSSLIIDGDLATNTTYHSYFVSVTLMIPLGSIVINILNCRCGGWCCDVDCCYTTVGSVILGRVMFHQRCFANGTSSS